MRNLERIPRIRRSVVRGSVFSTQPFMLHNIRRHISFRLVQYQERIRGGACNATVGWVESLLENDVTYGCGKSIHSNFHSPYKESKDSRYIHWLEPPGVK